MIPTKRLLLLVIFLSIFLSRLGMAQQPALPTAPDAVRAALLDGDYAGARAALIELRNSRPEDDDFWTYLEGRSYEMEGEAARAAGSYNALASGHPDSRWRHKADYRRAELLRGLGAVEEAEAVWSAALERLRGSERQDELAEVYLSAADEIVAEELKPDADDIDWARAADLYGRALELRLSDGPRDRALRGRLRCMEARKHWPGVVEVTSQWIEAFGGLAENGLPPRGDEGVEMLVDKAAAHVKFGDERLGRRVIEDLLRDVERALATGGTQLSEWPKWRAEATYWLARSWHGDPARAVSHFDRYLAGTPAPRSMEVLHEIAVQWQRANRSEEALLAYDALLAFEPEEVDEDQREANLELRMRGLYEKGLLLAQLERPDDAIATLRLYATRYPSGPHWTAAQQAIETTLISGIELLASAERESEERAAIEAFLAERPLHARAPALRLRIGVSWMDEGRRWRDEKNRPREVWEPALMAAITELERVVKKHPGSDVASEALFWIGAIHEHDLGELRAAIETYRRCDFGSYRHAADERRREMTSTELEVETKRTWRSNEAAKLSLNTRNLKEVELRIYQLDLESYFRKYSTHESIEDLDLDLIAPDQSVTLPVPGYAPYASIEFEPELPVEGPGVWAVTVVGDELTATTLVIVSDIDVITKVSRREVFVFAQDMLADLPASGVRLLCAVPTLDGFELHERVTDETGVARVECTVENEWNGASVLALRGADVAASGSGFGPLLAGLAETHRVFAHTERPVYRRGDSVHWRAVVRRLVDGIDQFEAGDPYELRIVDGSGMVVWESTQSLDEFGSLDGRFELDAHAPLGNYQLICLQDGKALSSTGFRVEEFQLQRVSLELTTDQAVYYRGELVELEATASFHYGSPVADARLEVNLPDGRRIELQTDADGIARYEYDTRDHLQSKALVFRAALTDEGVGSSHVVHLATQGYRISVKADRESVVVGDELIATLRTTAPDGEPVARALRVEWMKLGDSTRSGRSERRMHQSEVTTDDSGSVRVTYRPESSGDYLVRAIGEDRFGNPVSGEVAIEVSGDDDPQRLRFFAKRREFSVGETAELDLVNRMGSGLALVTIETDRVISYRIARLEEGKNLLRIDLLDEHAPNVRVAAAKMGDDDFADDYIELDVNRELLVSIEVPEDAVEPGSEVTIGLKVTDLLGKPVEAELSLAIIDEALFDLFPSADPSILKAFAPLRRDYDDDPIRTASSSVFAYHADTESISPALIAEQVRQEEEKQWDERRKQTVAKLAEVARGGPSPPTSGVAFAAVDAEEVEEELWNDAIGLGGGAGGAYGARFGGKRNLRASGGKGQSPMLADTDWLDRITAYWNPSVRTDAEGRATLRVEMPERSTRWRLTSHGAGRGSSFGDARAALVTRSSLFVEVLAPPVLTEGDRPTLVARVHNSGGLTGELTLELQYELDGNPVAHEEVLALNGSPLVEVNFPLNDAVSGSSLPIALVARGELSGRSIVSADRKQIPVRPWGLEVRSARSGSLESRTSMTMALPEDSHLAGRTLHLRIGRGLDEVLFDALLDRGPLYRGPRPTITTITDEAWTLVGLLEMLQMSGASVDAAPGQYAELLDRARGLMATLLSNRTAQGAWASCYGEREVDELSTAAAAIALGRAREFGLVVPNDQLVELRKHLLAHFRSIGASSTEEKALLLHALARVGSPTTDYTSRLFRERTQLSTAALAHLALALAADDRLPMAEQVAAAIEARVDDEGQLIGDAQLAFHGIDVERRALALWALHTARPGSPAAERLADSLRADRPWAPRRARGMAVAALAGLANRPASHSPTEVIVRCAGRPDQTIRLDDDHTSGELTLEFGDDDPEELQLDLELRGTGRPEFVAELSGSAAVAEQIRNDLASIWRLRYVASAPLYRGRPLPVGFSTVGETSSDADRNTRRECELGGRFQLQVRVKRADGKQDGRSGELQVLEIPLPPGTRVDEASLKRLGRAYSLLPGRLIVFLGDGLRGAWIDLDLIGLYPGEFRVLPAVVRSLERPQDYSTGAVMNMRVLPRGVATEEPYDPSPDEQYELGRLAFENGDRDLARVQLQALYRRWSEKLNNEPLRQTSRMLLDIAIEADDHQGIVEHFEVLGEKSPELYVDYEDLLAVAAAYRTIREHENALRIERALCIETFGKDLQVAGALSELGDFLASTETMRRLWLEYPDVPMVVESALTLSDRLLERAPEAHQDPALLKAGKDRAALTFEGILELQRFLAIYADDPQVSDAALNLLSALFELEDYERSEAFAARMAAVAEDPRYVDAFLYSQAVARWHLGNDDGAMELLARISEAVYTDSKGRENPSENRDLALYLLGQIHHARQEFAEASAYYERVAELFSDAEEALAGFRTQHIELDEVTEALPNDDVVVELRHRNLPELELLVYPVDLMTLYLRERSLSNVAGVQLSGIAPLIQRTVSLESGVDLRDRKTSVSLDLREAGAYLVMVRADEQFASGLVLISDLALEVDSDDYDGHVRVQVMNQATGAFQRDVDVRVIGSGNEDFISGRTDPRGLFVADGIVGSGTVIARAGDRRYAFQRGVVGIAEQDKPAQGSPPELRPLGQPQQDAQFLDNVIDFNVDQRARRSDNFNKELKRERKGLQVQQVK